MENSALKMYEAFIDRLVKYCEGCCNKWIKEKEYPKTPENKEINSLLDSLTDKQKDILVKMMINYRVSGIHDVLAMMDEMIDCDGLVITQNGQIYPTDTFESMHYDFICRYEGDSWPEE